MRLVLHDPLDASAAWVAGGLRARGLEVEAVSSRDLLRARRWHHRVDSDGATVEITLADGRVVRSAQLRGVVNRLTTVPPLEAPVVPADREYAEQERQALWLSWLEALPGPVLNRPTPQGLG
ncbi:MAG TPA: hypothetical protein VGV36_05080, partial [Solirubrobacteraceae bacterium]|nr:hypothetical protein [Solirubrobacteraceae bacterium]